MLKTKIDFVAFIAVRSANPNGDPTNDNIPRTTADGRGLISDVCIKRKIRNRMQDILGPNKIFVQSDGRVDDGYKCLSDRADEAVKGAKDNDEIYQKACELWTDVRTFGQLFPGSKSNQKLSLGVRGPVTIMPVRSIDPIDIEYIPITKSVNYADAKGGKASDTMGGSEKRIAFGLYKLEGSICVLHAQKTGFSEEDAELLKETLRTLFVNDSSAARPEGSMRVVKLYWFKHNNELGQYSTAEVHDSVSAQLKDGVTEPKSVSDYDVIYTPLDGLEVEEIKGV